MGKNFIIYLLLYSIVRYVLASINHDVEDEKSETNNGYIIDIFSLKLGNISNTWTVHRTNIEKHYPGKQRQLVYV